MRVLVTGGSGFIGFHLCCALIDRGDRVTVLDSLTDGYDPAQKLDNLSHLAAKGGVAFIRGDIRSAGACDAALSGADTVIHLAGLAGVRESIGSPELYTDVNVRGTAVLLARAARAKVKGVVFASSSSVYGDGALPFLESAPLWPISPYGCSKRAAELLISSFGNSWNKGAISCRLFSVYGPRQRPDLAMRKFAAAILRGEQVTIYGDCTRDYTHVSDTVNGLVGAAERAAQGGRGAYNIGRGKGVSTRELLEMLENKLGKKARVMFAPMQEGDVTNTLADIRKAEKELGYAPKIDIAEGVAGFARWMTGR